MVNIVEQADLEGKYRIPRSSFDLAVLADVGANKPYPGYLWYPGELFHLSIIHNHDVFEDSLTLWIGYIRDAVIQINFKIHDGSNEVFSRGPVR